MDNIIYWFGLIAKLLLFLVLLRLVVWGVLWVVERVWGVSVTASGWRIMGINMLSLRSKTFELEVYNLFIGVKWFDPTCRHFFKVNIGRLHVDSVLLPAETDVRKAAHKPKLKPPPTKPARKKRLIYWLLRSIAKRLEVHICSVEVCVHDAVDRNIDFLSVFQVKGHLSFLAQPMPNKVLAVSLEVEDTKVQFLMHSEKSLSSQEHFLPLIDVQLSCKLFLFLEPLSLQSSPVTSLQVITAPLSITMLQEGAFRYAVTHFGSYLPSSRRDSPPSVPPKALQLQIANLPKKVEVVLEEVSFHHHVKEANRVISSRLARVSLELNVSREMGDKGGEGVPGFSAMIGLQNLRATDSLSRDFLKLQQFRLKSNHVSQKLSNLVQVESLHSTLREEEAVFWGQYFVSSVRSLREGRQRKSSQQSGRRVPSSWNKEGVTSVLRGVMLSAVTTVEATDWSVSLRMDTPTLQGKEPLVQTALASCTANLQWSQQQKGTTTVRASLRLEDTYVHVPGYHPSSSSSSSSTESSLFCQRPDDPTVLPSLRKHQWGHLLALGNLTLKVEKTLALSGTPRARRKGETEVTQEAKTNAILEEREAENGLPWWGRGWEGLLLGGEPAAITGEGSSLMLEWSTPTAMAMLRTLTHLSQHYKLFGAPATTGKDQSEADQSSALQTSLTRQKGSQESSELTPKEAPSGGSTGLPDVHQCLKEIALSFHFTDANAFVYGLTPDNPALMIRLDAVSLSSPQPSPSPSSSSPPPSPSSLQLHLHGLLLDSLVSVSSSSPFLCSPLASLPTGVGVGVVNSLLINYEQSVREVSMTVANLEANWSPTHHRSLFHVITAAWNEFKNLTGVVRPETLVKPSAPSQSKLISIGETVNGVISKVPLSLALNLEKTVCRANVGRSARVSLILQTSHCLLRNGTLTADTYELGLQFDKHRIVTLENVKAVFPREGGEGTSERRKMEKIEQEVNPAIELSATKTKVIFPHNYNFAATFDKVMDVKKYLQKLHGGEPGHTPGTLLLPPDVYMGSEELVFQLSEDPFETKLKANYELMCDEYEQKSERLKVLEEKVEELRKTQGRFNLSAKKTESLYDSLLVKDCQIYCRRAQELHSSPDSRREELLVFSLKRVQLWAMFDPSMLGREKLKGHMRDMDSISPFPDGQYEFSTLWGVYLSGHTEELQLQLRDYPHRLLQGTNWRASGRMVFAEQEAQDRETRTSVVELGHPWKCVKVRRKLPPLKYYYDLDMDAASIIWSYGPCLEPALAQTNIAFNLLTNPTIDPSRPLAYWDKFRLLFHGHIHLYTHEMTVILPATFDPYNTVGYLELILRKLHVNLITNAELELEGSLQLYVHNATRYDECELANFPHVKTSLSCRWVCAGKDPHNHHAVHRCARDKVPVQPDKQEHDSYSAFRSHNVDVDWTLEALPQKDTDPNPPSLLLFSSTLKWLQQYWVTLSSNVTRPIRKGSHWGVPRKRKRPPLLRHWRNLKINAKFPRSVLTHWASVAKQRGVECVIDSGSLSIAYLITLTPFNDGLIRRPNRNWNIVSFSGDVKDLTICVQKAEDKTSVATDKAEESDTSDLCFENKYADVIEEEREEEEEEEEGVAAGAGEGGGEGDELTRTILAYAAELSYKRLESPDHCGSEEFTHQLKVQNTRILLNSSNKQVVLGLYDSYKQAQALKRDLSAEALKSIITILETVPPTEEGPNAAPPPEGSSSASPEHSSASKRVHRHSSAGNVMLDQLLKDLSNKLTVAEDRSSSNPLLKGVQLANSEDVRQKNWLIELTNIQVALQGIENWGFVVASSNITQVFGREHQPVLKEGDLVTKKSWLASVQDLQYFSTIGSPYKARRVPWLPLSVICSPPDLQTRDPSSAHKPHIPEDSESNLKALLSQLGPEKENKTEVQEPTIPGESVGGLVNCLLIQADRDRGRQELRGGSVRGAQLQRIASRCHCNVIYVSHGEQAEAEACETPHTVMSPSGTPDYTGRSSEAVDTLTVRYPNVQICTTSAQQALIMDILTNVLLHKEPRKKEALDHRARMQFMLQLIDIQDPRKPVLVQQNKVRKCLHTIRTLEKEMFLTQKQMMDTSGEDEAQDLEKRLSAAKDELLAATMKLRVMIRAFKEIRLLPRAGQISGVPDPVLRIELWLDDAHWWLTQKDGQLQIADIKVTNFSYNRVTFSDDSGEHRLELGTFQVQNLTPNTPPIYQQVLVPYDPKSRRLRVDRNICLRVYCRDKARVAGITVREHLEVNVVPLQVSLTARFFQTMQDFFFPKAEGEGPDSSFEPDHSHLFGVQPTHSSGVETADGNSPVFSRASSARRSTVSLTSSTSHGSLHPQGYSPPASPGPKDGRKGKHLGLSHLDTVEKMKERASHINTFLYVKIPQTTLCVTYKGENWSYKDLQNQVMTMPTLEYHNENWTWTDMLMEVKKDYKNAIIHQTLKSAIGMRESEESAGLASPKLLRHASDLLLGPTKNSKAGKGKKLFGKLSSTREDSDSEKESSPRSASPVYQPPFREPDPNLKRTYQKLTKLSQEAQK